MTDGDRKDTDPSPRNAGDTDRHGENPGKVVSPEGLPNSRKISRLTLCGTETPSYKNQWLSKVAVPLFSAVSPRSKPWVKVLPDNNTIVTRITARRALLIAPVPSSIDAAIRRSSVLSGLRLWYRDKAKFHFPKRAKAMANLLGIPTPIVQVVDQSKRWGSCDAHGKIRLNWRLVMAPMALVDYVIAHETCHILEHNHSHRFWRSLETIMPDYELRVRQLDRNGHMLCSFYLCSGSLITPVAANSGDSSWREQAEACAILVFII